MELPTEDDHRQACGVDLPIVVINLEHRADRWSTLCRRMQAVGLTKLTRAPAIYGAKLPAWHITALTEMDADAIDATPRSHLSLTRPAIGCFLSHLAIWQWIVRTGLTQVLVLEDDAAPSAGFCASRLGAALAALSASAGLIFPGRIIMGGLADRPDGSHLTRLYYFNGTFAYLIGAATADFLLRHLLPLRCHIDHQISSVLVAQRHAFAAYSLEPPIFEPDWSQRSDCYVPLADDTAADGELGHLIDRHRRELSAEGRPLLSPANT